MRKLEFNKKNDQVFNSSIDSSFYILLTYFSYVTFTYDFYLLVLLF